MENTIAIVDLGGQYCHLIKRRLRDLGVRSEIYGSEVRARKLGHHSAVILSGGPRSVYEKDAPSIDPKVLKLDVPILGICYGHQLLAQMLGAKVEKNRPEYGHTKLSVVAENTLFKGTPRKQIVWMSHSDSVVELPPNLVTLASTGHCRNSAFSDPGKRLYGVQFHPEVTDTRCGGQILDNFISIVPRIRRKIDPKLRVKELIEEIKTKAGENSIFFLVSGGVDSTVAFVLCSKALPRKRILGLYVDTGLMRKGETEELRSNLAALGLADRLRIRDESALFLRHLTGKTDPEEKRKIIGRLFVEVQSKVLRELGIGRKNWLLGQGTIYPDTIESGGSNGRAAVIKTHHNRCPEIFRLLEKGLVIEPLAEFYKDEVRQVGGLLGLDPKLTNRWPFPGPGLAIRCICSPEDNSPQKLDSSVERLIHQYGYKGVTFPIQSVGVQGDTRTYKQVVALKSDRYAINYEVLQPLSSRLCNLHTDTNRVILQITNPKRELRKASIVRTVLSSGRLDTLREADFVVRKVMEEDNLTDTVWQFPVVLIPVSFNKGESVVLRPVNSEDGMTADFGKLPVRSLRRMASEIMNIPNIDCVFLDVTTKPPATIEWE